MVWGHAPNIMRLHLVAILINSRSFQIAQQNQVNLQWCQTHWPIQMNIVQLATASKG